MRDHFTYGAGRRVCPGVHVAERSLYINIARTLWGFSLDKKMGADKRIIEPETEMVRGFLSVPKHFKAAISPRSLAHVETMRREFEEVKRAGI